MLNIYTILNYPKRLISLLLTITFALAIGIKWIYIDDDMKDYYDSINEEVPSIKNSGIYIAFGYTFGG